MQLFAPPDFDTYGGPRKANEGFFFNVDFLEWAISAPQVTTIGQPSTLGRTVWYSSGTVATPDAYSATQNNSYDTSIFGAEFTTGARYEGGFIYGHQGLLFNVWRMNSQTQDVYVTDMDMVIEDKEQGGSSNLKHLVGYVDDAGTILKDLPVTFATANIRNKVQTWGLELSYLIRSSQMHSGGYFECFAGARYLEFNDQFSLDAYGEYLPVTISGETVSTIDSLTSQELATDQDYLYVGTLANSFWRQDAKNHIVGPQIGARWFKHYGRWKVSTEGRFFAGCNMQTLYQTGVIGSELDPNGGLLNSPSLPGHVPEAHVPIAMGATAFTHQEHINEWSPGIEIRLNAEWQWTRNIAVQAGWTGIWMDGIARASNLINYELGTSSTMGILTEHNRQSVFMNGFNAGIVINR